MNNGSIVTEDSEKVVAINGAIEIGVKHDDGKHRWHLMAWDFLQEMVEVMQNGAEKYSPFNWKLFEYQEAKDKYFSAAQRHLVAYQLGELRDTESNKTHLAHAACCLMFLWWHERANGG